MPAAVAILVAVARDNRTKLYPFFTLLALLPL